MQRNLVTEEVLWTRTPNWRCPHCNADNLGIREKCCGCGYDSNCGEFPWYNPMPPYDGLPRQERKTMIVNPVYEIDRGKKSHTPVWDIRKASETTKTRLTTEEVVRAAREDSTIMDGILCYILNALAEISERESL